MPAKDKGAASLRSMIQQAVAEDATIDGVRQLIADVFATEKARKIPCPECGVEFRVPLPDVKAQVDTLVELLIQAEGRAGDTPTVPTAITIVRPPLD